MITKNKNIHFKLLYIFFCFLSPIIFFFSTDNVYAKAFKINNIEISKPFEMKFDKNKVIDEGFEKAFLELIKLITDSADQEKVNQIKLNEIKGMVESFTIKEEKFIDETYFVNLGVTFNKKEIFKFLGNKNIFPSTPTKKKLIFIPVIINENQKELMIFSKNKIYEEWNSYNKSYHLIEYILPEEDLEDLDLIKSKFDFIEQYNFKDVIEKYNLEDSIVSLIFINKEEIRILSKILINDKEILKNQTFSNVNIYDEDDIRMIIEKLKIIYEDYWKQLNQINTSIKLSLNIKIDANNNSKISNFEYTLNNLDLIGNFYISNFNNDFVFYNVIFNGTPGNFLKIMKDNDLNFDTQNKIWSLK
tara:strand:+ start:2417 stop:3496 length:1080 start_codon:yes stop_codon:yes gene_type:complete